MICVVAGGVGAARFLRGLLEVVDPAEVTVLGNVADDCNLHGLHISPDLDTLTYTLAGQVDSDRGWGLKDETWHAMESIKALGYDAWFNLGDRDLGTHMFRTSRLNAGATLAEVTAELTTAYGLGFRLIPVSNDRLRTMVTVVDPDATREVQFQEWFVKRHHGVPVRSIRFEGHESATPAPGVIEAIETAERIIISPSNPLVSVAPIRSIQEIEKALVAQRSKTIAISPIVDGSALKGPAASLLTDLGHSSDPVSVAQIYHPIASAMIIDTLDAALAPDIEALGLGCIATDTVMSEPAVAARLARTVLEIHLP